MPGFLRKEPSLDELEQQAETADAQLSLAEKKLLIKKVKEQYGEGGMKLFKGGKEGGGIKSGIRWDEIKFRLK